MRLTMQALPLPLLAVLAGCGGDGASTDGSAVAPVEVMEGTISDAMLPLATVRSQPPLLPAEPDTATSASGPSALPAAPPAPAAEPPDPAAAPPEVSEPPPAGGAGAL